MKEKIREAKEKMWELAKAADNPEVTNAYMLALLYIYDLEMEAAFAEAED